MLARWRQESDALREALKTRERERQSVATEIAGLEGAIASIPLITADRVVAVIGVRRIDGSRIRVGDVRDVLRQVEFYRGGRALVHAGLLREHVPFDSRRAYPLIHQYTKPMIADNQKEFVA